MSLRKQTSHAIVGGALTSGDAELLHEWSESLARQESMLSESESRDAVEYRVFREIEDRLARRCAELEDEVRRSTPSERERAMAEKYRVLEAALRASQEECAVLEKIVAADQILRELGREAEAAAEKRAEKFNEQSDRLRRYGETLNQEKEWIRATATSLEDEVRGMIALHPLRDYLQLTEKEATRVEIELKRMPAGLPARTNLEECLVGLIGQREFLRTVLETSLQEAMNRADTLARIRADTRSTPVPPVPQLQEQKSTSSKV